MRSLAQQGSLNVPPENSTFSKVATSAIATGGIVYLGDSITANANKTSGALSYTSIDGPTAWAQHYSGHALKMLNNAGVAGNRTDQAISRFATDVAAYKPQVVHIALGTNDAVQSVSAASIIANLTTLIVASQSIGAKAIVSGIPPRNALVTAQKVVRNTVNRWLADNCRQIGFAFIDVNQVLTDTGSSQNYATDHSQDGTHPTAIGAMKWGKLIAQRILAMAPASDSYIVGFPYDPKLLTGNPLQVGTGSTPGTGITGTLSPSWALTALGGTVTATSSKVARTDNVWGEWQQVQVTAQSATNVGVRMQINATTGFAPGVDMVYGFAEYQLDSDISTLSDMTLNFVTTSPGSVIVQTSQAMSNTSGTISTTSQLNTYAALSKSTSGLLVTQPILIDPTATNSVNLELRFIGLGTARFGRAGIMRL